MAISASSYGVGNRLYKGASSAPTRGRVDPMGYLDRELNKPSNSRSGIAAAALRRMSGGAGQTGPGGGVSDQPGAYGRPTQTQVSGQIRGLGGPTSLGAPNSIPGRAMNALGVSGTGKLQAPQLARDGGVGLPFDPNAADAQAQALARKNRFESEFTTAQQQLERAYADSLQGLERERPDQEREVLENYAGRGLAYSSGYSYDQGELQNQFARFRSELDQGKTDGFADLLRQRGLFNDEYAGLLASIQQAAARRAAERAAELELGVTPGVDQPGPSGGGGFGQDSPVINPAPVGPPPVAAPIPAPPPPPAPVNTPAPPPPPVAAPAPRPAPTPLVLNDPSKPPSHTNPYYDPKTQVNTPNMLSPNDPGMRGGKTIAQIAAEQAQYMPQAQPTVSRPRPGGSGKRVSQAPRPGNPIQNAATRRTATTPAPKTSAPSRGSNRRYRGSRS